MCNIACLTSWWHKSCLLGFLTRRWHSTVIGPTNPTPSNSRLEGIEGFIIRYAHCCLLGELSRHVSNATLYNLAYLGPPPPLAYEQWNQMFVCLFVWDANNAPKLGPLKLLTGVSLFLFDEATGISLSLFVVGFWVYWDFVFHGAKK